MKLTLKESCAFLGLSAFLMALGLIIIRVITLPAEELEKAYLDNMDRVAENTFNAKAEWPLGYVDDILKVSEDGSQLVRVVRGTNNSERSYGVALTTVTNGQPVSVKTVALKYFFRDTSDMAPTLPVRIVVPR